MIFKMNIQKSIFLPRLNDFLLPLDKTEHNHLDKTWIHWEVINWSCLGYFQMNRPLLDNEIHSKDEKTNLLIKDETIDVIDDPPEGLLLAKYYIGVYTEDLAWGNKQIQSKFP